MTGLVCAWMAATCLAATGHAVQAPLPDLVGARALAMGSAYVADGSGGPAHFHNPASLALLRDVRLFGQTNVTGRGQVEVDPKGIAYGWRRLGLAWGNRIAEDEDGIADYTYVSAGAGLSSFAAVGVSAKFWRSHPSTRFQLLGGSPTYDVGVLVSARPRWALGARAGQLVRGERPRAAAVGAEYDAHPYSALFQISHVHGRGARVDIGGEWRPASQLSLRAGTRGTSPTVGAGVSFAGVHVDVAWARHVGTPIVVVGVEASLGPAMTPSKRQPPTPDGWRRRFDRHRLP